MEGILVRERLVADLEKVEIRASHLRVDAVCHERASVLVDLDLEAGAALVEVILRRDLPELERNEVLGGAVNVLPEIFLGVEERLAVRFPAGDLARGRQQPRGAFDRGPGALGRKRSGKEQEQREDREIFHATTFIRREEPIIFYTVTVVSRRRKRRLEGRRPGSKARAPTPAFARRGADIESARIAFARTHIEEAG